MTNPNSAFTMPFPAFNPAAFATLFQLPESVGTLTRDAMAASTESSRASVKGLQEAGSAVLANLKDQMTLGAETGKKLSGVKSLEDALALQATYMSDAMAANVKTFTTVSELMVETLQDAFAPMAKVMGKTR